MRLERGAELANWLRCFDAPHQGVCGFHLILKCATRKHCNRHTFAGRLVMAGVDLRTVAELPGHRTFQMVMRYAHLASERQASAVDPVQRGRVECIL